MSLILSILWRALAALFIFYLPGHLGMRLTRRQSRDCIDFTGGIFLPVLTSILLSSLTGLILAQAGCFSLPALVLCLRLFSTGALACRRGCKTAEEGSGPGQRVYGWSLAVLLLAAASCSSVPTSTWREDGTRALTRIPGPA